MLMVTCLTCLFTLFHILSHGYLFLSCNGLFVRILSHPVFMSKPSTHRMHDLESIVSHIWPKVFTDNQIS
jgi:hypothetical protein